MRQAVTRRCTRALALITLATALSSRAALGQAAAATTPGGPLHLSWVRSEEAASCPDANRVMADVAARLGASPFSTTAGLHGSIEVQVRRDQRSWYALMTMRDATDAPLGVRRVQSYADTCDSLASAAVLAIALMIQPSLEPTDGQPQLDTPPPDPPLPPSEVPTAERVAPTSGSSPRPMVKLGASAIAGALPSLGVGPVLEGGMSFGSRFVLLVGAHYFPQQWLSTASIRAGFGLSLASLSGCLRFPLGGGLSVSSCGVVLAGALHVSVDAAQPIEVGDDAWLGAGCGLGLSSRLGPLELDLNVAAVGHVDRRDYQVERIGKTGTSVFVEPAVAGLTSLTLGTRP